MYQIGTYYTFDFKETYVASDGNTYLRVIDPENPNVFISIKPCDSQIYWDNTIPSKIKCYCYKQNIRGQFCFEQSREDLLNYLYAPYLNHHEKFVIEKRLNTENGNISCVISDVFGLTHLYYPKDPDFWSSHNVGDEVLLYITGVHTSTNGKNNAYLKLVSHEEFINFQNGKDVTESASSIRDEKLESLGKEDDHTEFKSSIAFPAGGTKEDMPKQLSVLMQTIAGFMNKDGGTLYIGVNDSGEPFRDVSEEFQYLNDDDDDDNTYNATEDHYKQKLHNKIRKELGDYASSLVNIDFRQANGVTYAAIEVKRSISVVWYKGTKLLVRCDNCTRCMKGDGITKFILSRVSLSTFQDIINRPITDEAITSAKKQKPKQETLAASTQTPTNDGGAWRFLSLLKNGQWSFRKTPYNIKEDLITEVTIPNNPKSYVMMIAYESGKVNAVALKDLLYGSGKKKNTLISCDTLRNGGIDLNGGKVVNVFCVKNGGLILMESEVNGDKKIKAHQMEAISTHLSLGAQGNKMQPEGNLVRIAPIEANSVEMNSILAMGILVKDYERYHENGVRKLELQGKYRELIDSIFERTNVF